jgi:voltage-gated potassium channel Kch
VVDAFNMLWVYLKTSWELASDRRVRPAFVIIGMLVGIGTVFYKIVEHWTWLDAFYFSVIALTTVGFGDVTPETRLGKLFTVAYVVIGIGIFFVVINSIARIAVERIHMPFIPASHTDEFEVQGSQTLESRQSPRAAPPEADAQFPPNHDAEPSKIGDGETTGLG